MKTFWNKPETKQEDYSGQESETIPNRADTPQDILKRHTQGRLYDHIQGYYEFDGHSKLVKPKLPNIDRFDKQDKIDFYRDLKDKIELLKKDINDKAGQKKIETVIDEKVTELENQEEETNDTN